MSRVAVLAGGRSLEREVSLRSGHRVRAALLARGHDAFLLDPSEGPFVETLCSARVNACYVALHGREGEDGSLQRLLEILEVAYTGTRPRACQVAFDKIAMKEAIDAAGIPTPPWAALEATALRDLAAGPALPRIVDRVGLPLVVKPARAGSAMGVGLVDVERDLPHAVMSSLSFSDAAIIERRIEGVEVAAGMIGGALPSLPLVEIQPKDGTFDYAARYTPGATEYFVPARLDPEVAAACHDVADRALDALGVREVGRVDLMVDPAGAPWVIDVNTSPGMTETSLLPMAARAGGIGFEELCEEVLAPALERGLSLTT